MPLDQYSTHTPVVAGVMQIAPVGDVLELGAGGYSTPLLHALCKLQGRNLVTVESDDKWLADLLSYSTATHKMIHARVPSVDPVIVSRRWAVAFVDNGQFERKPCMDKLVDRCDIMIVHDTERPDLYDYEPFLSQRFSNRVDLITKPWKTCVTSVLSNTQNLDAIRDLWK